MTTAHESSAPMAVSDQTTKTDDGPQTENTSLIARLRSETQGEHRRVEAIPFNERIMAEEITMEEYVDLIACHLVTHEAFDDLLVRHDDPRVRRVFNINQAKTHLLEADLRWCIDAGANPPSLSNDAIRRARELARTIQWLGDDAACALGFFYVFEGSTMGGIVLRKKIASALDLESNGLSFYTGYGRQTAMQWRQTCQRFDAVELSPAEAGRTIAAANLAFLEIGHILAAL